MQEVSRSCGALAVLLALAACTGDAPEDESRGMEPAAPPEAQNSPEAEPTAALPHGARSVSEETDDFLFEYSYPAEAGDIPDLAALLDRRLERTRSSLAAEAIQAREEASDSGFPYNKHSSSVAWEVVADTPRFLSLSADISSYSGGAHGMYGFDGLVWDKQEQVALEPAAFFTSPDALDEALGDRLCDALDAERARRRGEPVDPASQDMFDQCVSVAESTLLLGSRGGTAFDRIGIQIGPYVAGPYAEGAFEFTFDVTSEVIEAVAPEYRDAFASRN